MRVGIMAAVATCVASSPAEASSFISGTSGYFNFTVTSGFFDPADQYDPQTGGTVQTPGFSLTGYRGFLRFVAKSYAGVERPYPPFGTFDVFDMQSAMVTIYDPTGTLPSYRFTAAASDYEPDPGSEYNRASFVGGPQVGAYSTLFSINGGMQQIVDFSYNGASGGGRIRDGYEDRGDLRNVDFTFAITAGGAASLVPEPATWGLMLLGFGAIGGALRRRQATVRGTLIPS